MMVRMETLLLEIMQVTVAVELIEEEEEEAVASTCQIPLLALAEMEVVDLAVVVVEMGLKVLLLPLEDLAATGDSVAVAAAAALVLLLFQEARAAPMVVVVVVIS